MSECHGASNLAHGDQRSPTGPHRSARCHKNGEDDTASWPEWFAVSALVSAGTGVCLIPRIVPIPAEHHVVHIALSGKTVPSRRFITCLRRGSSQHPAIHAGLATLRSAVQARTQRD